MPSRGKKVVVRGVPVSPGLAVGIALFHEEGDVDVPVLAIQEGDVKAEQRRLQTALSRAKRQLASIQERIEDQVGAKDAAIFSVQSMLLDDPALRKGLRKRIQDDLVNAEVAIRDEIAQWSKRLAGVGVAQGDRDPVADLRDVGRRVLRILAGKPSAALSLAAAQASASIGRDGSDGHRSILIARELLPSDTAHLDRNKLAGIITASGGAASHAAILARSLGIPAVTGIDVSRLPAHGGAWIVDGTAGHVIVEPNPSDIEDAQRRSDDWDQYRHELVVQSPRAALTKDDVPIHLYLNVENWQTLPPHSVDELRGIGLYRTEFLFMNRPAFPSEEEQYDQYCEVLRGVDDRIVTFRTIDVGGDKPLPYLSTPHEPNPVLGWRGLRLSLEWPDLFYTQIRALLRASAHGRLRILLPMVTMVEEFRRVREIVDQLCADLESEGVAFDPDVALGAMIEVPAAALAARNMAREADFLSIGTNDLSQYALAVDRNNARVADLYQPLHPGVLRLVQNVIEAGMDTETSVSVCGEMAGDPEAVVLLLGMGLRSLSMPPFQVPVVKRMLAAVTIDLCEDVLRRAYACSSTTEIRRIVRDEVTRLVPGLGPWLPPLD